MKTSAQSSTDGLIHERMKIKQHITYLQSLKSCKTTNDLILSYEKKLSKMKLNAA